MKRWELAAFWFGYFCIIGFWLWLLINFYPWAAPTVPPTLL